MNGYKSEGWNRINHCKEIYQARFNHQQQQIYTKNEMNINLFFFCSSQWLNSR